MASGVRARPESLIEDRIRVLRRIVEIDPEDVLAREALAELSARIETDPWVAHLIREADACTTVGLRGQAIEHLERALLLDPRNDEARARLHHLLADGREPSRPDETLRIASVRV
jgi:predicted TPR repeat methyltransferase